MKTKIIGAFSQISKKSTIDNVLGHVHTVLMASIQSDDFPVIVNDILSHLDYVVDTFFTSDEIEE